MAVPLEIAFETDMVESMCTVQWWFHSTVLRVIFAVFIWVFLNLFRHLQTLSGAWSCQNEEILKRLITFVMAMARLK